LHRLARYVAENRLQAEVQPKASFCFEACDQGPTVQVGDQVLHRCDLDQAVAALEAALDARRRSQAAV
jgi:NADH:ubiquinone oxidoreductase subunit E